MTTRRYRNDEDDESSIVSPLLFGFDFNFTQKIGMELCYEHGHTEIFKEVKARSSLASLLYHFK
jgi:hypothetical protein